MAKYVHRESILNRFATLFWTWVIHKILPELAPPPSDQLWTCQGGPPGVTRPARRSGRGAGRDTLRPRLWRHSMRPPMSERDWDITESRHCDWMERSIASFSENSWYFMLAPVPPSFSFCHFGSVALLARSPTMCFQRSAFFKFLYDRDRVSKAGNEDIELF